MLGKVLRWLREIVRRGDPAALLPDAAVEHMAVCLAESGVTASPPFLGAESNPFVLMHPSRMCACGKERAVYEHKSSDAVVLDVTGPLQKKHVPQCCRNAGCKSYGKLQWHNFLSVDGQHLVQGEISELKCFMITTSFGLTTSYLAQLHFRMVREHASFKGEAEVAADFAELINKKQHLPARLRLYLSEAWFMWRLALRVADLREKGISAFNAFRCVLWPCCLFSLSCARHIVEVSNQSAHQGEEVVSVDLLSPVEKIIEGAWDKLVNDFETGTARKVRQADFRRDVHVIDGNAKNRRLVCAAPVRQRLRNKILRRTILACCPHTPQLCSKFCKEHNVGDETGLMQELDYEIVGHETLGAVSAIEIDSLKLEIKRAGSEDTVWVDEALLPPDLVRRYFQQVGAAHLEALASRKRQRVLARKGWADTVADAMGRVKDEWADMSEAEKAQALPERAAPADLAAVACRTHKETPAEIAQLAKTAGVLCACISSGVVVMFREIFGCESLSQRYFLVADLANLYPECTLIVHDDACHMHKFTAARASMSEHAARLAPPCIRYVCDEFHMSGHTDDWCMTHCNPKAPDFSEQLDGIRTSVCEFTFTWMSGYKFQTKHMSEWGFKFFLLEMISAHNAAIFKRCL